MTTPKWMLGLMAVAALLVAEVDGNKELDDSGAPKAAVTLDEE